MDYKIKTTDRQEEGLALYMRRRAALLSQMTEERTVAEDGTETIIRRPAPPATPERALQALVEEHLEVLAAEAERERAAEVAQAVAADPKLIDRKEAFEKLSPERRAEIDAMLGLTSPPA